MSDNPDSNVHKCLAIADQLSSGKMSPSDGALAILKLIHDNRTKASESMFNAIVGKKT